MTDHPPLDDGSRLHTGADDAGSAAVESSDPDAPPRWEQSLPADTQRISEVRRAAVAHLDEVGVTGLVLVDAEMVIAELLANAVAAGEGDHDVKLALDVDPGHVVITVINEGRAFAVPDVSQADPLRERGRGLRMVRMAASTVDVRHQDGTTTVVASFRRDRDED